MRILKITTLPPSKKTWVDRDFILLHACFQLLVDWVEKEDGLNHCSYEAHKESIDIMTGLYNWWKENSESADDTKEAQEKLELLIKHRGFLWT